VGRTPPRTGGAGRGLDGDRRLRAPLNQGANDLETLRERARSVARNVKNNAMMASWTNAISSPGSPEQSRFNICPCWRRNDASALDASTRRKSRRRRALIARCSPTHDYLIRMDDDVTCKTCQKRFEIPSHQSMVFLDSQGGTGPGPNDDDDNRGNRA
jgi:hypothetical protein